MPVKRKRPKRMLGAASLAAVLLAAGAAGAQTAAEPAAEAATDPAVPSESVMVNLVHLLIEQGIISREKGAALMQQATAEAAQARAAAQLQQQLAQTQTQAPSLPAPSLQSPSLPAPSLQAELAAPAPGAIRVPYVPETVRAQIRDELKKDVLAQAKAEGWAAPGDRAPEWVRAITLSGDIRVRSQSSLYSETNSNLIPDFARINEIGPIPIFERDTFIPLLNTREDRLNRLLVRARLGLAARLGGHLEAGLLLASGDDDSPISTNESLGGGFAKRDIWLQNAFVRARPTAWSKVELGRFPNPFFSTDLLFDDDLAFDGIAAEINAGRLVSDGLTIALRGGAFPLDFGNPNFPENDVDKRSIPERWLFSGQLEVGGEIADDISVRVAGGYHSFKNVQANLSEPCFIYRVQSEFRSSVVCSTDDQAAQFLRKGNTVFPIRDIVLNDPPPQPNEVRTAPQLVGLVYDYDILNVGAEVGFPINDRIGVKLRGDFVKNLSFKSDPCRFGAVLSAAYPPLNNIGPDGSGNVCAATDASSFVGGDTGYMAMVTIGHSTIRKWGEWRAEFGYRYLESDAVLDAFTDSEFHLGGTNAKGFVIGAKTGLYEGLTIGARWLSANEIEAEPLSIDVLQVDLQVAF